jgi:hypothetical protein
LAFQCGNPALQFGKLVPLGGNCLLSTLGRGANLSASDTRDFKLQETRNVRHGRHSALASATAARA